jgi:polyisoprenoid-binding protein YceI
MKKQFLFSLSLVLALNIGLIAQTKWSFDKPHTSLQFSVSNMGISEVNGRFTEFSGIVKTENETFENATIKVTVDAQSINTDNATRDDHLRSEDFLHVEKYPEVMFKSTSFEQVNEDEYKLIGELTIRGVTNTEEFEVEYKGMVESNNKRKAVYKLTGTINRFDYNVDWNDTYTGGLIAGEKVHITANVMLVK